MSTQKSLKLWQTLKWQYIELAVIDILGEVSNLKKYAGNFHIEVTNKLRNKKQDIMEPEKD